MRADVRVDFATASGCADVPNEDAVAASVNAVVVVDGVTAPRGMDTGCVHGTPWFANTLACEALATLARRPTIDLKQALRKTIDAVAADHADTCDLAADGTPSATVAILREGDMHLDYLVLSDATVVIQKRDGTSEAVRDGRVGDLFGDLRRAVHAASVGSAERAARLADLVATQRKMRNVEGGYWLAGTRPEAADHALTGSIPLAEIATAAAMTDGASRLVDLFGLMGWAEAMPKLTEGGPFGWILQVRQAERRDSGATQWPRYKVSDDAAIAVATF
jgi:hypothetical protein